MIGSITEKVRNEKAFTAIRRSLSWRLDRASCSAIVMVPLGAATVLLLPSTSPLATIFPVKISMEGGAGLNAPSILVERAAWSSIPGSAGLIVISPSASAAGGLVDDFDDDRLLRLDFEEHRDLERLEDEDEGELEILLFDFLCFLCFFLSLSFFSSLRECAASGYFSW